LPTKDHFSSNCASRVRGGKSHDAVVEFLSVLAGEDGQADDGIFVDANQAARLADATTLLQVLENGDGFVLREFAVEQGRALAFGEALLAGAAGQDAALVGTVAEADAEVVAAALAVVFAVGVLAAEGFQVVHGSSRLRRAKEKVATQLQSA
jgi:hypothetical protein